MGEDLYLQNIISQGMVESKICLTTFLIRWIGLLPFLIIFVAFIREGDKNHFMESVRKEGFF